MKPTDRRWWYAELARQGFDDLEDEAGRLRGARRDELDLHVRGRTRPDPTVHVESVRDGWEALAEYYRMAGVFLHEHTFRDPIERRIWELHADGASYTRITRTVCREIVAGELRGRMYRRRAHAVVTRLRAVMLGLRGGRRRGRPRDAGRLGRVWRFRLSDAYVAALERAAQRLKKSPAAVIRMLIAELDKHVSQAA